MKVVQRVNTVAQRTQRMNTVAQRSQRMNTVAQRSQRVQQELFENFLVHNFINSFMR